MLSPIFLTHFPHIAATVVLLPHLKQKDLPHLNSPSPHFLYVPPGVFTTIAAAALAFLVGVRSPLMTFPPLLFVESTITLEVVGVRSSKGVLALMIEEERT